jgi:hypothetical protein
VGCEHLKIFEDLSNMLDPYVMHELDCAVCIFLSTSLSLLNKTDEKPKPKTFHFEGSSHFWILNRCTARSKTIILASFSQKTFPFLDCQKDRSCPQNEKSFWSWPDFDPT